MGYARCVETDKWFECSPVHKESGQLVVKLADSTKLVIIHEDDYQEELTDEQINEIKVKELEKYLMLSVSRTKLVRALVKLNITVAVLENAYNNLE